MESKQDRCHLMLSRFGLIVTTIQLENEELQQKLGRVSKYELDNIIACKSHTKHAKTC